MITASLHTWHAAGRPPPPYDEEGGATVCATCATPMDRGIPLAHIETPSTANHADYFRFGSQHVCPACAWLFAAGKGRPGNYVATPGRMESTVISLDSVVPDKRPWLAVLPELLRLPSHTPVAGVMTTDVKPRLWPRVRLASIGRFGLYLHAPDYDVSEYRCFRLPDCLRLIAEMLPCLRAGYSKASLTHGLLRDYARTAKDPERAWRWDSVLRAHRGQPHFLPALIAAGIPKERPIDATSAGRFAGHPDPAPTGGHPVDPPQPGLF